MRRFIVKALWVSGKGNLMFKSGDKVNESQFPKDVCDDMVAEGFLTEETLLEKVMDRMEGVVDAIVEEVKYVFESEPKKYVVKALSVQGTDKMFASGDNVTDKDFGEGEAERLVAEGFIEEEAGNEDGNAEHVGKKFLNTKGEVCYAQVIGDITTKELMAELTAAGIAFNSKAKRPELFELWFNAPVAPVIVDVPVKEKGFIDAERIYKIVKSIDDISEDELMENLMEEKIDFSVGSDKEVLFELWFANATVPAAPEE